MYDLKTNLEPGNPDGHTVLRYLIEVKQMPLEVAIEQVYRAVNKYAQDYRADQKKLMTGIIVTGVLSLPVFFPFGISSLLIAGAIGASAFSWQEFGVMRDRLKPEYAALKGSVLIEQFIKWLAQELKERRKETTGVSAFQSDTLTTANILAAYEHTIFAVTNGEHLENNASDPILALFVLKLRQHTNHLPEWVISAFSQLEQAEVQRANDMSQASAYMWGNMEQRYPPYTPTQQSQIGQNTRLGAVDVPAQSISGEGENSLGKPIGVITNSSPLPKQIVLFDFTRLKTEPDKFAHLRIIGGTGIGKTTFADWLLDVLGGDRFVITPKKKSWHWVGLKVHGLWFDYQTIREKLQWIHAEMYRRYPLMAQGQTFEISNFVVDEWRLINTNIKAIRERDPETKQSIEIAPSAKAMMKDIITVARESMLRLIALAQGENVASWGFEGESDLEECFTDIRLGEFAIDYAKSLRNQCRKDSDDYEYWTAILQELEWQNEQRTRAGKFLPCCMVAKSPARIPDLTDWQRDICDVYSAENEPSNLSITAPSTQPSLETPGSPRKVPFPEAERNRKPDGILVEAFSARIEEALQPEAKTSLPPLFDELDREGKLLMLRLLLNKRLGKEKTILLAWGLKSGGRSHDKYKLASELLDAMIGELLDMGFSEENNWGIN